MNNNKRKEEERKRSIFTNDVIALLIPVTSLRAALPPKMSIEAIRKLHERAIIVYNI